MKILSKDCGLVISRKKYWYRTIKMYTLYMYVYWHNISYEHITKKKKTNKINKYTEASRQTDGSDVTYPTLDPALENSFWLVFVVWLEFVYAKINRCRSSYHPWIKVKNDITVILSVYCSWKLFHKILYPLNYESTCLAIYKYWLHRKDIQTLKFRWFFSCQASLYMRL